MNERPSERPTCATCPYWSNGDDPEEEVGKCRRAPPTIVDASVIALAKTLTASRERRADDDELDSAGIAAESDCCSSWPGTYREDWCGEHPDFPAWLAARRSDGDPT